MVKIPNKGQLQKIASNHSSGYNLKDFMRLYKDYTKDSYSFVFSE